MEGYDAATYGDRIADVYDERAQGTQPRQVELLHELAGGGPVLELGIGTGRLDIPRLDLSSGSVDFLFGPMCPGDVLVIEAVVVEAAVKDADETVPE
jgi:hypothetical protein